MSNDELNKWLDKQLHKLEYATRDIHQAVRLAEMDYNIDKRMQAIVESIEDAISSCKH